MAQITPYSRWIQYRGQSSKKKFVFFFFIIIIYKIRRDMSNKILGPTPLHARHVTFNQEFNPILGSTFGGVGG
jgi:hypothetical protein